jgi:hypothetical protein
MTQDPAWVAFLSGAGVMLLAGGTWFWRLERPGLLPEKGSLTLSWTLRRWLGIRPAASRRLFLVPLFLAFLAAVVGGACWLGVHIVLGG